MSPLIVQVSVNPMGVEGGGGLTWKGGERGTLFRWVFRLFKKKKKKKKKKGIDHKGAGQWTIFRLLGILPKITNRMNSERYSLFRGV